MVASKADRSETGGASASRSETFRTVIQIAALGVTCAIFVYNANVLWFLKQRDVTLTFQQRFDDLVGTISKEAEDGHDPTDCYFRFWTLQEEQFEAWMDGLIPDKTYRVWMLYRAYEAGHKLRPGKQLTERMSYQDGWAAVKDHFREEGFVEFINTILKGGDAAANVDEAFALMAPTRAKRLSAWHRFSLAQD